MGEIIEATYKFLDRLDKSLMIKNITKYRDKLLNNGEVLKRIKDIKELDDNEKIIAGRKEIFDNADYKEYIKNYNELHLLIMDINKKYKEYTLTSQHNCGK